MKTNNSHLYSPDCEDEAQEAAEASRQITAILGTGDGAELLLYDNEEKVKVPIKAVHMLREILDMMAKGDSISIVPIHAELTTQQAADFLNVSRPYFVKILEEGNGPSFHQVGRHRRVYFKDLVEFRNKMVTKQDEALDSLVAQAQELNMGY